MPAELELSHFEVVLHITVLMNFLYAVSKNEFSEKILPLIASPFKGYFNNYLLKQANDLKGLTDKEFSETVLRLKKRFVELDNAVTQFNNSMEDYELGYKFKGLYMLGGLYSFFLLMYVSSHGYINSITSCCTVFHANLFILAFYSFVFIRTFFDKYSRVKTAYSLYYFFLVLMFVFISYKINSHVHCNCWFEKGSHCMRSQTSLTVLALLIVLLPIILHIVRVGWEIFRNFRKVRNSFSAYAKVLKSLKSLPKSDKEKEKEKDENIEQTSSIIEEYNSIIEKMTIKKGNNNKG